MAFPSNPPPVNGDVYTNASGIDFIFTDGYWKLKPKSQPTTPVDIAQSNSPNMTITEGNISGLPYIQVKSKPEQLVLKSELDGSDHSPIDINAGYF